MATTKMRTPTVDYDEVPGQLPETTIPEDVVVEAVAQSTIDRLNNLRLEDLAPIAIWRDLLSLTDTFRTFQSRTTVLKTFKELSKARNRSEIHLADSEPRRNQVPGSTWIELDIEFKTREDDLEAQCAGTVAVMYEFTGDWKIWMLRTWLESYDGHGHPDKPATRSETNGHVNGVTNDSQERVYGTIIAGGGQAGLGLAGRLQALGVSYIMFDNRPKIGDSWAHRYDSLHFHTIKEYGNLPFGRTWREDDEKLLPKDRIAFGYEQWSLLHRINVHQGTSVDTATWDEQAEVWTVHTSGSSGSETWKAENLVLCIGTGHKNPVSPEWASLDKVKASGFEGTILHSTSYHNVNGFEGKRGIVVGTANTAHDVAEDMANAGMYTTMCQRKPTFIFPGEWLVKAEERNYNLQKPTEISDREEVTPPTKVSRESINRVVHSMIKQNPERFDQLEKAGFKVDKYGDLFTHLYIRFGGHYVDVGASQRIVNGEIKVKTQPIKGLSADGLVFEDGTELPADLIVLATGFNHDFRQDAKEIVGEKVANQMDDYYGPDPEGELRAYARLAGHPHLYYFGGECRSARFYSRFVALQIQKEVLGKKLKPYLVGRASAL